MMLTLVQDPLSRYEGYKRFMAHNKLYHDRMAQIAAEVAATLPQHLLLVSQAQLQCAGVEIVMSTSNTNHKYVIWPGKLQYGVMRSNSGSTRVGDESWGHRLQALHTEMHY